jgi:hypothetical protein
MGRYYALFFIGHGNRRVWLAGYTANPNGAWVTQQARNLGLDFSDQGVPHPDPGPRQQVQPPLRRSLPQRRHPDRQVTSARAEGERDSGALRPDLTSVSTGC